MTPGERFAAHLTSCAVCYDVNLRAQRGLPFDDGELCLAGRWLWDDMAAIPNCGRCLDRVRCARANKCTDAGEGDDDSRVSP